VALTVHAGLELCPTGPTGAGQGLHRPELDKSGLRLGHRASLTESTFEYGSAHQTFVHSGGAKNTSTPPWVVSPPASARRPTSAIRGARLHPGHAEPRGRPTAGDCLPRSRSPASHCSNAGRWAGGGHHRCCRWSTRPSWAPVRSAGGGASTFRYTSRKQRQSRPRSAGGRCR
jgi:hypothetical protein